MQFEVFQQGKLHQSRERGGERVISEGCDTLTFILNFSRSLMLTLPHKHSHTNNIYTLQPDREGLVRRNR